MTNDKGAVLSMKCTKCIGTRRIVYAPIINKHTNEQDAWMVGLEIECPLEFRLHPVKKEQYAEILTFLEKYNGTLKK
ncbi:MAG: hypothetical protein FVQ84_08420 [Planctomycetes bacterium]|nr:hypothetical protein [Planctomycetota bacterium]